MQASGCWILLDQGGAGSIRTFFLSGCCSLNPPHLINADCLGRISLFLSFLFSRHSSLSLARDTVGSTPSSPARNFPLRRCMSRVVKSYPPMFRGWSPPRNGNAVAIALFAVRSFFFSAASSPLYARETALQPKENSCIPYPDSFPSGTSPFSSVQK